MQKDFKVIIAEYISLAIAIALIIFGMIFFKMQELSYKFAIFTLIGYSILELGFIATHLALNREYKLRQMITALFVSYSIFAIVLYYLEKYLSKYDELIVMYWLIYFIGIAILTTVFLLLNKFKKEKKMTLNDAIKAGKNNTKNN
jgi:FlaA1/EpsC-like NDP-sugar epimerase